MASFLFLLAITMSSDLLVLTAADVEEVLNSTPVDDLVTLMGRVFSRLTNHPNAAVCPQRLTVPTASHNALFMPARITPFGTAMKVVSVPTTMGDTRGLPASTLVLDEETGAVRALLNASALTAYRTAAGVFPFHCHSAGMLEIRSAHPLPIGSVLATCLLLGEPDTAKPNSILAFGAGKQIEAHVDLLLRTYPSIERVAIINRTVQPRATDLLRTLLPKHPEVHFTASPLEGYDLRTALASAAIVVTATSATRPLFGDYEAFVHPGTHFILVGSYTPDMHEVSGELLARTGNRASGKKYNIVVDSRSAALSEAGELIAANVGPEGTVELGELLTEAGDKISVNREAVKAVKNAGDVTVFKSVGVGVQDVAIAAFVVQRASEMGLGTSVPGYHLG